MSADLAAGLVVVVVVLIASGLVGYQLAEARALARARRSTVRANPPQPEPVEPSWVPVSHDDILFFLSPELRGEFANSPNFNNTLIVEAPSGASLPSDFRSLVKQYEQAVLQGTATTNDYRKIETAIRRSLQ